MGNCVSLSLPLDHSVNKFSQWLGEKGGYISNLKKNLVALEKTMEELKAKRDDLSRRLKREEDRGLQRLAEFQVWLNRVEAVEKEVNALLIDRDVELQRLCLCGFCSKSFMSSHRYGKNVVLMLKEVEKLKCSGVFDVIAEKALTSEVEERPLKPTIVGQETMLEKAWKHLMEDRVGVMGMYGMGGVGKTTLLTQINNKFGKDRCGFDLVIWVVVSKELHVEKIQDEIAQKVDLGEAQWNQKDKIQKAVHLYNFLRKKKFVLFLDDIWEKVDLAEIGVPFPARQNQCKVAFTTRSHDVCTSMGVEKPMEVKCLMDNDALDLFQKKVGQITLGSDPEIPNLAKIIAKKCCGLPLALNVIGETMSCKRTIQEWRTAIDVLNSYAAEFSGMEDKILPLLKYSYDNLKREQVKSCLLYCALFPEDHIISKLGLIEYWICEGIIDESEGMERAKNQGYEIIGSLIHASLLMEEEKNALHEVYMHDVVREMALWITSDFGKQKNHFIVRAGAGLYDIPKVKNWNGVRRISLMSNKIDRISGSLECLELTTLFLQRNKTLVYISDEFFRSMPRLVVLDLSHNKNLCELPDGMSELVSLRYLNMSWTRIQCLPVGLLELKNLLHLNLEWTGKLLSIVGIFALLNLKVLKLRGSRVRDNPNTVDELQLLEHLELLTIEISYNSGLVQFLSSHKLMFCTQALEISGLQLESTDISLLASMEKVYKLVFDGCTLSDIKMDIASIRCACFLSLSKIYLSSCKYLKELTWLMFAPNLTKLFVEGAYELEDIINKEKACVREESGLVLFQKLEILHLANLPEVKNIYWRPLPFPCLSDMIVLDCPKRRKLPLNSRSGSGGGDKQLVIKCREREWIKRVEWEDEATKARFVTLIP